MSGSSERDPAFRIPIGVRREAAVPFGIAASLLIQARLIQAQWRDAEIEGRR